MPGFPVEAAAYASTSPHPRASSRTRPSASATSRRPRRQAPFLAQLSADQAVDYTRQGFDDVVRDIDVVLDLAGGQTPLRAVPTLRDGGLPTAVTLRWDLAGDAAGDRVRVTYMLVEPDRAGLEAIAELADSGWLRVHVAQTIPRRRRPRRMSSARPDRAKASSSSRSTDARRATSSTHLTAASRGTWCEASL